MRGKGTGGVAMFVNKGITPAYAGKSRLQRQNVVEQGGSPPPMRGKVRETSAPAGYVRITPAYAGKSSHRRDL